MCKSGKIVTIIMTAVLTVLLTFNFLYLKQITNKLTVLKENVDFAKLQRANVLIKSGTKSGSGTVINIKDGYIYFLTACHVVTQENHNDRLTIEIPVKEKSFTYKDKDYGEVKGCQFVDVDKDKDVVFSDRYDLALIRIKDFPGHELSYLPLASKDPKVGDTIYVVGNPMGIRDIITKGIYTGAEKIDGLRGSLISSDITFGCSGGALVNDDGEIIGIVFAKVSDFLISYIGICVPRRPTVKFVREAYEAFTEKDAPRIEAIN